MARLIAVQSGSEGDQLRSLDEIGGIKEASDGHLYEIAVAQIFFAIGIGKLHRFPDDMPAFRIVLSELRHIEAFDHGQNLQHGNSAGGGRPHAADGIDAIMATDGRSEEHTSEPQSLMRISYAVFCLKKK